MQINRFFAFALTLLASQGASAQTGETTPTTAEPGATTIDAQRLEVYLDRKMHAIGDAELHQNGQAIFGDRIDYDVLNEALHVIGNTRIEQGGNTVTGTELRMKLDERIGEMKEPVFTMRTTSANATPTPGAPKFARGDARSVQFEGPGKERLFGARYTTCEAGDDSWFLRAGELELDHHTDTGTAKHASVEFKGVPILYTPWIDFPFHNQRKSGFLSPSWATTSRSGFDITLPYYWNIAPNMDATLGARYMSKRGMQVAGEFRYLNENFSGEDRVEYLASDNNSGDSRYFVNLKHRHVFGNGWSGDFNIERVSDDQYFADMTTHIITTSRVNLPQQANLNWSNGTWNFNALAQQYQTLDKLSYPYQRLPQLTLTGAKDWDWLSGSLYTQFVRFDRSDNAPSSVTGNRFTAYPSISLPLGTSYGYVTPKFGVHYTKYDLSGNTALTLNGVADNYESDTRVLPIFSVDSGLYFDRDVRIVRNRYTQTLEPRIFYAYIPYQDQRRLPIFDTAESDLNLSTLFSENQYTGNDRVNNANQISLAVTSRLIDASTGIQRLAATVGQRFYFSGQKVMLNPNTAPREADTSDIITAVTARLLNHWNVDAGWQYNTDADQTVKSNIGARYNPEPGKTLNLSYRYTRNTQTLRELEQIDLSTEWPFAPRWYGLARLNYSIAEKRPIETLAGAEYDAGCWQARAVMQRVETATANANYALYFQLELGGLASIGTSPLSLLKRSIPGYSSSALVPDNFQQY